jgi:phospholipase/lecithinase/hemolysin
MTSMRLWCRNLKRAIPAGALALTVAWLAACGGGTSQVQSFKPSRLVVLGDENSLLVDDGQGDGFKYSINDRSSTAAGKCQALPIFSQTVASLYGLVFKECNPQAAATQAVMLARTNARVEDADTGIAAQVARVAGGLGGTDLVTLMIGGNDMVALWEAVRDGRLTNAAAVAEAQRLGGVAAQAVNVLLATRARALVVTIPDMGLSPYALAQDQLRPGAKTLLATMSYEFNAFLRTRIDPTRFDGRNYALVLGDDVVTAMVRLPTGFLTAPYNVTDPACTTASVRDCLTTTLATGATTTSHLWASDRHIGPEAHRQIGLQAQSRSVNNPF